MTAIADNAKDRPFGSYERTLAFRYLRAKREHGGVAIVSILSLVGIMLAVMALVVTMSIMNGFRAELLNRILGASGHVKVYTGNLPEDDAQRLIDELIQMNGISGAAPLVEGAVLASGPGGALGAYVRGMRPDDAARLNFLAEPLYQGSRESFGEGRNGGNEILVSERLARSLGLYAGDSLTLIAPDGASTISGTLPRRKAYTVGGVFEIFSGNANPLDDVLIVMPLDQAQLFFNQRNRFPLVELVLSDPQDVDNLLPEIQEALPPGTPFQSWKELYRGIVGALAVERSMMRIIFLILITITALNIITGIVMLVKNKARDVAILRTIGASRATIMRVFIMIGAILGVTGTLLGLFLGLMFCWNIVPIQDALNFLTGGAIWDADVYGLPYIPAMIDWTEVGFATGYAFLVAVLVAILPAWNAARLDPVEALRFE